MKKIFALLITLSLIAIPLFAGGSQESTDTTEKTYVVAANAEWPPFEYVDDSGAIVGFEMDLVRAIAEVE